MSIKGSMIKKGEASQHTIDNLLEFCGMDFGKSGHRLLHRVEST